MAFRFSVRGRRNQVQDIASKGAWRVPPRGWARGYAVSTVGCEEEQLRRYIRSQEQLETEGEDEDGAF